MTQSTNQPTRNTLGPAYTAAESLYTNAVALSLLLDAYSKRDRAPTLSANTRDYISHNLLNAEENLHLLRQALADALDTQEEQWHPNADCAADAAATNSPTATAHKPTPPSTTSATAGTAT